MFSPDVPEGFAPPVERKPTDWYWLLLHEGHYYAVNKPPGMVCTNRDPSGRARVIDLVPNAKQRLFTVGRLDLNSEGLIILTNDGELANRLTHPRYGVPKTYRVLVAGLGGRLAQITAEGKGRIAPQKMVVGVV